MLQRYIRCFGSLNHPQKLSAGWKRTGTSDASKSPFVETINSLQYSVLLNDLSQQLYYVQVVRYFEGMRAYSFDSREWVAAACLAQAGRTIGEVAAQFNVSGSFVRKLRRRQRTNASRQRSFDRPPAESRV